MKIRMTSVPFNRWIPFFAAFSALILFGSVVVWGIAVIVKLLYPIFSFLAVLSALGFLCVIVPLSFVKPWRLRLAVISFGLSFILGASIWMYSLLVTIEYLGWFAIFFTLLFQSVVPIAVIGLFFKGQGAVGLVVAMGAVLAYVMRFYAVFLEGLVAIKGKKEDDIIDVQSEVVDE